MVNLKTLRHRVILIALAFAALLVLHFIRLYLSFEFKSTPAAKPIETAPLILFYSPIVRLEAVTIPTEFDSSFINSLFNNSCSFSCHFSLNKSKSKIADVIVHNINIFGSKLILQAVKERFRTPQQVWVMFSGEPPTCYLDKVSRLPMIKHYANVFNWTWTYRRDSDVYFPFGAITKRRNPDFNREFDRFQGKTSMAVAMISHCYSPSRENYINELIEAGLQVDVLGDCRKKFVNQRNLSQDLLTICQKNAQYSTDIACETRLESTYKFFLSFENSLCRDYITEKFFRPASLNLIPVVRNGVDMSLYAPEGSYINVNDFASTKLLVEHLKKIGSDRTLYNSYFKWKPFYGVELRHDKMTYLKNACDLCRFTHRHLSSPRRKHQSWADIEDWYLKKSRCTSHLVLN